MHRTSTNLTAKFDAIEENCNPQPFLRLAATAKNFISVASLLSDVRDESEFEKAFSRFVALMVRFYGALTQAYDMGLLINVDEKTKPAPRELRELDRALEHQQRRAECIDAVCRLAQAASCLVGIRRFPNYYYPWTQMFELLLEQPLLAALFQDIDLAKWTPLKGEPEKRLAALAESSGFRRIGIKHCCLTLTYEAGELWTDSLIHGLEEEKLEACASRLRRLLNFVTTPPRERWILQELLSIGSTDSMQAVLKEIVPCDLRRVVDSDNLDQDKVGEYCEREAELPSNVLVLIHGWLRKQKYLLILPDPSYFVERMSSAAIEEATADPINFLRTHWRDGPRSAMADHCQRRLQRVESATRDVRFARTMEHAMANLAGETFALAVSSSVGTSPEVSIFIAGCFGIVVDVMMRLRKR